jgi:hypothetical protein
MFNKGKSKKKYGSKKLATASKAKTRTGGSITSTLQQAIDAGKLSGVNAAATSSAPPVSSATKTLSIAKEKTANLLQEQAPSPLPPSLADPVVKLNGNAKASTSTSGGDTAVDETVLKTSFDDVSSLTTQKNEETVSEQELVHVSKTVEGDEQELVNVSKTVEGDEEPDVASNLYEGAKGVWIWGKLNVPFADVLMGFAESVANSVLEVTTGNNLHKVDEKVIKPHLTVFDAAILNPALRAMVDSILESEQSKEQNPFHSFLLAILRPPVRFLIKVDEEATGETSVEG